MISPGSVRRRFFLICAIATAAAFVQSDISAQQPDVLVIYHGYAGTTELAGVLNYWQYSGGHMLVEFSESLASDGIFHNGFEGSAIPAGLSGLGCGPYPCP